MARLRFTRVACATVLCAGTALGTQTPQERCDQARVMAWKKYVSCVDTVVAKNAGGNDLVSANAAFAQCLDRYLGTWTAFQEKSSLTGSSCIGSRFTTTDSGATVSDALTGLVWEKQDGTVGGSTDASDPQNVNNEYSWSTGAPYAENGTAFTAFLTDVVTGLNVAGFAGAHDWRLPTLAELQSILLVACTKSAPVCGCVTNPCIDPAFGPTQNTAAANGYWSATSWVTNPGLAWNVPFDYLNVYVQNKMAGAFVRAVRGGL
jgi:hypothetical protein